MVRIQITGQLFFPPSVVAVPMVNFHFNDILAPMVIHNHIGPCGISGLRLHIIIPHAINNWPQIQQKKAPPIFFQKPGIAFPVYIRKIFQKFFHHQVHIQKTIPDKLIFLERRQRAIQLLQHVLRQKVIVHPNFENTVGNHCLPLRFLQKPKHRANIKCLAVRIIGKFPPIEKNGIEHVPQFRIILQLFFHIIK